MRETAFAKTDTHEMGLAGGEDTVGDSFPNVRILLQIPGLFDFDGVRHPVLKVAHLHVMLGRGNKLAAINGVAHIGVLSEVPIGIKLDPLDVRPKQDREMLAITTSFLLSNVA